MTRFGWPTLIAFFLGIAGGLFMSRYSGPLAQPPEVRQLLDRLHKQTVRVAQSDTALAFYRHRLTTRDSAIAHVEAREHIELAASGRTQFHNRTLIDSLRAHPESVVVYLAKLDSGIVAQGEQCSAAARDCQAVKDSLRVQLGERDSIIVDRTAQRDTSQTIAVGAVAGDVAAHKALFLTRVVALVGIVGALLIR